MAGTQGWGASVAVEHRGRGCGPGEQFGFDPPGNGSPGQEPENGKLPGPGHPTNSWTGSDGLRPN